MRFLYCSIHPRPEKTFQSAFLLFAMVYAFNKCSICGMQGVHVTCLVIVAQIFTFVLAPVHLSLAEYHRQKLFLAQININRIIEYNPNMIIL